MCGRYTITEWALSERPREKFIERGAESLTDSELLAILIRAGNREENAIELARKVLAGADNSLANLRRFTYADYSRFKGIGAGKALSIMAAFELGRRCQMEQPQFYPGIHSSEMAASILIPMLRDLGHEECWILMLNKANKLIGKERISKGGLDTTVVDIRLIIKSCIEKSSCHIVLAHNHPSGSCKPGASDKAMTEKLKKGAMMCDIELVDHIIVAGNEYFSFADEGLL